jgi:serine/threonine protein kinase/ActR/RegA family two-component response regulator
MPDKPTHVLIVEDDEDLQTLYMMSLRHEGFTVSVASSGTEALALIQDARPEIVILDLGLPEISGDQLCRIIKESPALRDMVVVILTSRDDLTTKLACFAAGANDYLVKPLSSKELAVRVQRFDSMIRELRKIHKPAPAEKEGLVGAPVNLAETHNLDFAPPFPSKKENLPRYGAYIVEKQIGAGGMGHVFKGYEEALERPVAIKILSPHLASSPEFVERFRREARAIAAIDHVGIAGIYSFGEEQGELYFAMQWCSGGSLDDLIRIRGRLDVLSGTEMVIQCARALASAQVKGIVHRDIKPKNIMFDDEGRIKIVDFGLALMPDQAGDLTHFERFMGTPQFASPEQAKAMPTDFRSDMYSLGITFYYMLYGKLPFKGPTAMETLVQHTASPFPPYDDLEGRVPVEAYRIIEGMTQKEPAKRYQDYSELLQALEATKKLVVGRLRVRFPRTTNATTSPMFRGRPLLDVLSDLFCSNLSGALRTQGSQYSGVFLVRNREVIGVESQHPAEMLSACLDLGPSWSDSASLEVREEAIQRCLAEGRLSRQTLSAQCKEQIRNSLLRSLSEDSVTAEFTLADVEEEAFASVSIADVLLTMSRNLKESFVARELHEGYLIGRTEEFETVVRMLRMTPEESFVISRFEDQGMSLETLLFLTGLSTALVSRFVFILGRLGALRWKPPGLFPQRRKPPAPSAPAAVAPSPPAVAPRQAPAARKAVTSVEPPKERPDMSALNVRMEVLKPDSHPSQAPRVTHENLFSQAKVEFEKGDYWKVTQLCSAALKMKPKDAAGYYHLMGLAYQNHRRFLKDAEASLRKASELEPWNVKFCLSLARFYQEQGAYLRAIHECKKALEAERGNTEATALLAELKKLQR